MTCSWVSGFRKPQDFITSSYGARWESPSCAHTRLSRKAVPSFSPRRRMLRTMAQVWHDDWRTSVLTAYAPTRLNMPLFLVSHRVPWAVYASMSEYDEEQWSRAQAAKVRAQCILQMPPCPADVCPHASTQRVCTLEVQLEKQVRNQMARPMWLERTHVRRNRSLLFSRADMSTADTARCRS